MPTQLAKTPENVKRCLTQVQPNPFINMSVVHPKHMGSTTLTRQVSHLLVLDKSVMEELVENGVDIFSRQYTHLCDVLFLQKALIPEQSHDAVVVRANGIMHDAV